MRRLEKRRIRRFRCFVIRVPSCRTNNACHRWSLFVWGGEHAPANGIARIRSSISQHFSGEPPCRHRLWTLFERFCINSENNFARIFSSSHLVFHSISIIHRPFVNKTDAVSIIIICQHMVFMDSTDDMPTLFAQNQMQMWILWRRSSRWILLDNVRRISFGVCECVSHNETCELSTPILFSDDSTTQ